MAKKSDPFERKQLLQTKRYAEPNKIGSQEVRMYRTLYDQEEDVDTVAIITTGEFTPQGSRLAKKLNVEVVDGRQLCNLIDEYAPDIEEYILKSREKPRPKRVINQKVQNMMPCFADG